MPDWVAVCAAANVEEGVPMGVKVGDIPVGLFRVGEDICALHDVCSHAFALLSQGFQEDGVVECPLHGARFDIRTGAVLSAPATEPVRSLDVRVVDGEVQIRV